MRRNTGKTPKFGVEKDPLQKEFGIDEIQPLDEEGRQRMIQICDELIAAGGLHVEEQKALHIWKTNLVAEQIPGSVKHEFHRDFYRWLLGRGRDVDHQRTPWGRQSLADDKEVSAYLDQFVVKAHEFRVKIELLKMRRPTGIYQTYLYYKYIVRGVAGTQVNFLRDWDILVDEFGIARALPYDQDHRWRGYGPHETAPYPPVRGQLSDDYYRNHTALHLLPPPPPGGPPGAGNNPPPSGGGGGGAGEANPPPAGGGGGGGPAPDEDDGSTMSRSSEVSDDDVDDDEDPRGGQNFGILVDEIRNLTRIMQEGFAAQKNKPKSKPRNPQGRFTEEPPPPGPPPYAPPQRVLEATAESKNPFTREAALRHEMEQRHAEFEAHQSETEKRVALLQQKLKSLEVAKESGTATKTDLKEAATIKKELETSQQRVQELETAFGKAREREVEQFQVIRELRRNVAQLAQRVERGETAAVSQVAEVVNHTVKEAVQAIAAGHVSANSQLTGTLQNFVNQTQRVLQQTLDTVHQNYLRRAQADAAFTANLANDVVQNNGSIPAVVRENAQRLRTPAPTRTVRNRQLGQRISRPQNSEQVEANLNRFEQAIFRDPNPGQLAANLRPVLTHVSAIQSRNAVRQRMEMDTPEVEIQANDRLQKMTKTQVESAANLQHLQEQAARAKTLVQVAQNVPEALQVAEPLAAEMQQAAELQREALVEEQEQHKIIAHTISMAMEREQIETRRAFKEVEETVTQVITEFGARWLANRPIPLQVEQASQDLQANKQRQKELKKQMKEKAAAADRLRAKERENRRIAIAFRNSQAQKAVDEATAEEQRNAEAEQAEALRLEDERVAAAFAEDERVLQEQLKELEREEVQLAAIEKDRRADWQEHEQKRMREEIAEVNAALAEARNVVEFEPEPEPEAVPDDPEAVVAAGQRIVKKVRQMSRADRRAQLEAEKIAAGIKNRERPSYEGQSGKNDNKGTPAKLMRSVKSAPLGQSAGHRRSTKVAAGYQSEPHADRGERVATRQFEREKDEMEAEIAQMDPKLLEKAEALEEYERQNAAMQEEQSTKREREPAVAEKEEEVMEDEQNNAQDSNEIAETLDELDEKIKGGDQMDLMGAAAELSMTAESAGLGLSDDATDRREGESMEEWAVRLNKIANKIRKRLGLKKAKLAMEFEHEQEQEAQYN